MFAGQAGISMADRFTEGGWDTLATGAPVLLDAVVALDCIISDIKECGTHTILFGNAASVRLDAFRDSLIYFNRQYHTLPVAPLCSGPDALPSAP